MRVCFLCVIAAASDMDLSGGPSQMGPAPADMNFQMPQGPGQASSAPGGFGGFDFGKPAADTKKDSFDFGSKPDSASSFTDQSSASSSGSSGNTAKQGQSQTDMQLAAQLSQLQKQEEQTKKDLYSKQQARLNAAKAEIEAETEEDKKQQSLLALQQQERKVRQQKLDTEEKLLGMETGSPADSKKDKNQMRTDSASPFGGDESSVPTPQPAQSFSFGSPGGQSGGFSFGGAPQQQNNNQNNGGFSFGGQQSGGQGGFNFGAQQNGGQGGNAFNFGAPPNGGNGGFSFGQQAPTQR